MRRRDTENISGLSNFFNAGWGLVKQVVTVLDAALESILPYPSLLDAIGDKADTEGKVIKAILANSPIAENSETNEYAAPLEKTILKAAPLWIVWELLERKANPAQPVQGRCLLAHCKSEHRKIALTLILIHDEGRKKALNYFDLHAEAKKDQDELIEKIRKYDTVLEEKKMGEAKEIFDKIQEELQENFKMRAQKNRAEFTRPEELQYHDIVLDYYNTIFSYLNEIEKNLFSQTPSSYFLRK